MCLNTTNENRRMLITCMVPQHILVFSFQHTIRITEKHFLLSCWHFKYFSVSVMQKQRHTDFVYQRAQFHHVLTKKGLRQYISITMAPTYVFQFQQYNTLIFQHVGQTSLMQMICVYSPRLWYSAANSLRLESERFCSNVDIPYFPAS
jgi:hypothetical protein